MYCVLVQTAKGDWVALKNFKFGDFVEIGYWLDEQGYNDSRYQVVIRFQEDHNVR